MTLNILKDQIALAKEKTDKLIADISFEKWFETPDVLESNLNWQIGHIILANYLHGIASISGVNEEFNKQVNIPDFIKFYGPNSNPSEFKDEKPSSEKLLELYDFTLSVILESVENITQSELEKNTAVPNPAVNTKYEALQWLPQHQSWHNGQIATLKRVLNKASK